MEVHKAPAVEDYWSTRPGNPIHPIVQRTMSRERYKQLNRYFQIHDTSLDNMRLYSKVEEVSDCIRQASLALWVPATRVSVDEAMVPFDGRASEISIIKNKPISTGFKLWTIAQRGHFLSWLFH